MSEKFFKVPKWSKCVALDGNMKRCQRPAKRGVAYHGSNELYGYLSDSPEPQWLIAYLCKGHSASPATERSK